MRGPDARYTANGVRVSDFYTPHYFDPSGSPRQKHQTQVYDFQGHISAPRQVLPGGYLSWRESDGTWFQELFFGTQPEFKSLGQFDKAFGSLRAWIDAHTQQSRAQMLRAHVRSSNQVLTRLSRDSDNDLVGAATRARASRIRADVAAMRKSWKSPVAASSSTRAGVGTRPAKRVKRSGRKS